MKNYFNTSIKNIALLSLAFTMLVGCQATTVSSSSSVNQPANALVKFNPERNVYRLWRLPVGTGANNAFLRLDPVLSQGVIYTTDPSGVVTAVNTKNAKVIWRKNVVQAITTGPAVDDTQVYVVGDKGYLTALNKKTGGTHWRQRVNNTVLTAPVVSHHVVVIKTIDGVISAYNSRNGKLLWHFDHGNNGIAIRASGNIAVNQNTVVAGFADGMLVAIDITSGRAMWMRAVGRNAGDGYTRMGGADIDAAITLTDDQIILSSFESGISVLSIHTGANQWSQPVPSYGAVAVTDNAVFVANANGYLYGINTRNGRIMWRQTVLKGRGLSTPQIMGNCVVVGDRFGYAHWFNLQDGHYVTRAHVSEAALMASPVVANYYIAYFLDANGLLSATQQTQQVPMSVRH